jgi:hypothetical protein
MNVSKNRIRLRAVAAAAFLLLAGGLSGVLVDRLWLLPRQDAAMPLTAEAMAERLNLDPGELARIRALLDSMHADVLVAARHGPDSLIAAARRAHERIEIALPPLARPEYRLWIQDQHRQMMERMHGPASTGPAATDPQHDDG